LHKQPNRTTIKALRLLVAAALLSASLTALVPPRPAHAATITVNSAADNTTAGDGDCTLREAINNANDTTDGQTTGGDCAAGNPSGADTITLPAETYTLAITGGDDTNAAGDLDITSEVTISGEDAGSTIIQAGDTDSNGIDRVFHVVNSSGNLALDSVTVRHGRVTGSRDGGGIYTSRGTVNVDNSTLSGNSAGTTGGGIFNDEGTVNVNNSTLADNSAEYDGGGIYNGIRHGEREQQHPRRELGW